MPENIAKFKVNVEGLGKLKKDLEAIGGMDKEVNELIRIMSALSASADIAKNLNNLGMEKNLNSYIKSIQKAVEKLSSITVPNLDKSFEGMSPAQIKERIKQYQAELNRVSKTIHSGSTGIYNATSKANAGSSREASRLADIKIAEERLIKISQMKQSYSDVGEPKKLSRMNTVEAVENEIRRRKELLALVKEQVSLQSKLMKFSTDEKDFDRRLKDYEKSYSEMYGATEMLHDASEHRKTVKAKIEEEKRRAEAIKVEKKRESEALQIISELEASRGKISITEANKTVAKVNKLMSKLPAEVKRMELEKFQKNFEKVGVSTRMIGNNLEVVRVNSEKIRGRISQILHDMFSWEKLIQRISFVLTATLSYRAFDIFGRAIKDAITKNLELKDELSKTFALIQGITKSEEAYLTKSASEMMVRYRMDAKDVSEALYEIISAQIGVRDATLVLDSAMRVAKGGFASAKDSALALVQVLNAFDLSATKASHIADVMFQTTKLGIITTQQFSEEMSKVASTASIFGIQIEEITSAISVMTRNGLKVDQAFTALNQLLMTIAHPTKQAKDMMERYGVELSLNDVRAKGLVGTLKALGDMLESEEAMSTLVKTRTGFKAFASLVKNSNEYLEDMISMYDSIGASQEASNLRLDTTKSIMEGLGSEVQKTGRNFGAYFEPLVRKFYITLTSMFKSITKNVPYIINGLKTIALQIGLMKLPWVFGLIAKGFVAIKTGIIATATLFKTNMMGMRNGAIAFGTVMKGVWAHASLGITLIISLIAQLGSAYMTHIKEVRRNKIKDAYGLSGLEAELTGVGRTINDMNSKLSKIEGFARMVEQSEQLKLSLDDNVELQDKFLKTLSDITGKQYTYKGVLDDSKSVLDDMNLAYLEMQGFLIDMQQRRQKLVSQSGIESSFDIIDREKLYKSKSQSGEGLGDISKAGLYFQSLTKQQQTLQPNDLIKMYQSSGGSKFAMREYLQSYNAMNGGGMGGKFSMHEIAKQMTIDALQGSSEAIMKAVNITDAKTSEEDIRKSLALAESLEKKSIEYIKIAKTDNEKTYGNETAKIANQAIIYFKALLEKPMKSGLKDTWVSANARGGDNSSDSFKSRYFALLAKLGISTESSFGQALKKINEAVKKAKLDGSDPLNQLAMVADTMLGIAEVDEALKNTGVNTPEAVFKNMEAMKKSLEKINADDMKKAKDALIGSSDADTRELGNAFDELFKTKKDSIDESLLTYTERTLDSLFGKLKSDAERVDFVNSLNTSVAYKEFISNATNMTFAQLNETIKAEETTAFQGKLLKTIKDKKSLDLATSISGAYSKDGVSPINVDDIKDSMEDISSVYSAIEPVLDKFGISMSLFNEYLNVMARGTEKEQKEMMDELKGLENTLPKDFFNWTEEKRREYIYGLMGTPASRGGDSGSLDSVDWGNAIKETMGLNKELTVGEMLTTMEQETYALGMKLFDNYLNARLDALEKEKQAELDILEQNMEQQQALYDIATANENMSAEQREVLADRLAEKKRLNDEKRAKLEEAYEKKRLKAQKQNAIAELWIEYAKSIAMIWARELSTKGALGMPIALGLTAFLTGIHGANLALLNSQQFDKGGYTGDGGKYEPAGIVHKGEIVIDKDTTSKNFKQLMGMYSMLKGGKTMNDYIASYLSGSTMPNKINSKIGGSFASGGYVKDSGGAIKIDIDLHGAKVIDDIDLHKRVESGGRKRRYING